MGFSGTILLQEIDKTQRIGFTAIIRPPIMKQPLLVEAFQCIKGEGISLELAIAFLNKATELIDLPYFEIKGIALRLQKMDVQEGRLTLYTEAYVRQLPDLNL